MNYIAGYEEKYAIIIGINEYKNTNNLLYAVNDAVAIADLLEKKFEYNKDNIELILDKDATKKNILDKYIKLIEKTNENDSVIVFYAGHGYTQRSKKNDVGFLVPTDASVENINTLIRWDELTRNADFIKAKHMLFIMDACYSGLAVTRGFNPGTSRFLKDMLQRYSRQVLVAGKGDQVVSDGNGPLPEHSIFTGHLIEGLNNSAKNKYGIITANGLMSYVYNKVANDTYSNQTPHYGFIDGDGDFIININEISNIIEKETSEGNDLLIDIPSAFEGDNDKNISDELVEEVKELVSEDKNIIKLEGLVNFEIRKIIELTSYEHFSVNETANQTIIDERIEKYEDIIKNLQRIIIILCCWGKEKHLRIVEKIISMLANNNSQIGGTTSLINLRWYPIMILIYSGMVSSLASNNFEYLSAILNGRVTNFKRGYMESDYAVILASNSITDTMNIFNKHPEGKKYHYPFSEYIYKKIQPMLDDLLFLGNTYEDLFDISELLISLKYVDIKFKDEESRVWGPQGRFAYKYEDNEEKLFEKLSTKNILNRINIFDNDENRKKKIVDLYQKFLKGINRF